MKQKICLYCGKLLFGRSDKKYCTHHCKSAHQYEKRKTEEKLFLKIDRHLKTNRRLLKSHNKLGKTVLRKTELIDEGFNPKYFTHYWKNAKGQVYLFCFEFGFLEINDRGKEKYLLIQWQEYMERWSACFLGTESNVKFLRRWAENSEKISNLKDQITNNYQFTNSKSNF